MTSAALTLALALTRVSLPLTLSVILTRVLLLTTFALARNLPLLTAFALARAFGPLTVALLPPSAFAWGRISLLLAAALLLTGVELDLRFAPSGLRYI
jgi:hypothetical protein